MRFAKKVLTLGIALGSVGLASCATPPPECTVGPTTVIPVGQSGVMAFAVRYALQTGTGACADLKGEVIGMQAFHPATPEDPQIRDFSKTTIAIRTQTTGELLWMKDDMLAATEQFCFDGLDNDEDGLADDQDDDCQVNAIGDFTSNSPDANDFCQVQSATSSFSFPAGAAIDMEVPCTTGGGECGDFGPNATCEEVDPDDPTVLSCVYTFPQVDIAYEWTNLQFYVTAAATGTQFSADLKVNLNGSECTYKAIGMWPAVDCTDYGNSPPSDALCNPEPDPANPDYPRAYGSGINPDFGPVVCDATLNTVPSVDDYSTYFYRGYPVSTPRCVIQSDTLPALEPNWTKLSTEP